jgi:rare lipoprotein A
MKTLLLSAFFLSSPALSCPVATYYHNSHRNHITASGERYNPNLFTAASRRFPLQTMLEVSTKQHSVLVRVNDRKPGCALDLSRAAAARLEMLRKGRVRVHIRRLSNG